MKNKIRIYIGNTKGILITLAVFIAATVIGLVWFNSADKTITQEQADLLRDTMYSAAVNCYAVNGHYPTLDELTDDYGIVIDSNNYNVIYTAFASNVLPDIQVYPAGEDFRR